MSICGVKCIWSLYGFQDCVFFFPIHLDTVDGCHRDVGSVGRSRCFLVPAEEVLDLQGGGLNGGENWLKFQKCFRYPCLFSSLQATAGKIVHLIAVISAIE